MVDRSSEFIRKQMVVLMGGVVCLGTLFVSLARSDPGTEPLPQIVKRAEPKKSEPTINPQLLRPVDSQRPTTRAATRSYVPKDQAEWEGWMKAKNPDVPIGEVFVSSELRIIEPNVRELAGGTMVVSGTTSITVEGSFTLADDIPSVPPSALLQLAVFTPQGTKRIYDNVWVHDLEVDGKTYNVRATVLEARKAGEYHAILRASGRDLAKVKVRFE